MNRGSILVESVVALSVTALAVALMAEMVRRSWLEAVLAHGAFVAARAAVLGGSSRAAAGAFLAQALGERFARTVLRQTDRDRTRWGKCETRLYLRYPSLARFSLAGITRHHFEITAPCRFPCSR